MGALAGARGLDRGTRGVGQSGYIWMKSPIFAITAAALLFTFSPDTVSGRESEKKDRPNQGFVFRLSEQDVILPVASIEWGHPDRLSFTSRYVHGLEKGSKRRTWQNSIGISLSPGISGGRLGVGYIGTYSPPSLRDFALFTEVRGVLLRTWGNPLPTYPGITFAGAELKICISWLLDASIGYYSPVTDSGEDVEAFWGFHFGIGI